MPKPTSQPTDLVVPSTALSAPERKLLANALREAEDTRNVMEDALVRFGRWVLVNVFGDDARAALDDRSKNAVWLDLIARAGGPTLRLSPRMLYVAVHIAARDKRINDESWRNLEPGRKELLLPLGDEKVMRKAAQYVTSMKLSQRATRQYVGSLRAADGDPAKRRVTGAGLIGRVRRFRASVTDAEFQKAATATARELDHGQRDELAKEYEALRTWATSMLSSLRRR